MRDNYWMHRGEMEEEIKEEEVKEKYVIITSETYGGFTFDHKACKVKKPQHIFGVASEEDSTGYRLYSIKTGKQIRPEPLEDLEPDYLWCFLPHEVKEITLEKLNKKLAKRGLPPWK